MNSKLQKFRFRPGSWANFFTYGLFTVFPVVMFSVILVLKFRNNYLEQVEHLKINFDKMGLALNSCRAEQEVNLRRLHTLESYQLRCRVTLFKASQTLSSLNAAFKLQWDKSNRAINHTRHGYSLIEHEVSDKDNPTTVLMWENDFLRKQLEELTNRLDNVTHSKLDLKGQLGKIKTDLDRLKSNTSRLEGEKQDLRKVLEVESGLDPDDDELIANAKTLKSLLHQRKKKKKADEDEAAKEDIDEGLDDDSDEHESKGALRKEEKESVEKIVKEHIEKLGLTKRNDSGNDGVKAINVLPVPIIVPSLRGSQASQNFTLVQLGSPTLGNSSTLDSSTSGTPEQNQLAQLLSQSQVFQQQAQQLVNQNSSNNSNVLANNPNEQ